MNDKVIADLTALNNINLLVMVASYETTGWMAEVEFLDDNYFANVTGDTIRVFFRYKL